MILFANKKMVPCLKNIWAQSFIDDTKEQIDLFFDEKFKCESTVVYEENNEIVSVIYMLECEIIQENLPQKAICIYAAATKKGHEKKGYMSALLEYVKQYAAKNYISAIILHPGSESLRKYYEKRGYNSLYSVNYLKMTREQAKTLAQNGKTEKFSVEKLLNIRNSTLSNDGSILWNERSIEYAVSFYSTMNGTVFCTNQSYALYYEDYKRVFIEEFFGTKEDFCVLLSELLSKYSSNAFEFTFANSIELGLNTKSKGSAMILFSNSLKAPLKISKNAFAGLNLR